MSSSYHESATGTVTPLYIRQLNAGRLLAHLQQTIPLGQSAPVANRDLARAIGCSPGLIPALLRVLHQDGWIFYTPAATRSSAPSSVILLRKDEGGA